MGEFTNFNFSVVETNPNNDAQLIILDSLSAHTVIQIVSIDNRILATSLPHFLSLDAPNLSPAQPGGINAAPLPDRGWVHSMFSPNISSYSVAPFWTDSDYNISAPILTVDQRFVSVAISIGYSSLVSTSTSFLYIRAYSV